MEACHVPFPAMGGFRGDQGFRGQPALMRPLAGGDRQQPGRETVLDTVAAGTILHPTLEGPGPARIVVASVGARSPAQRFALAAGILETALCGLARGWRSRWLHACLHRRLREAWSTSRVQGPGEPFVGSPLFNARLATTIAERADVSLGGQTLERTDDDRRGSRPSHAFPHRGMRCHVFRYGSGRHGTCDGGPRPGPC